MAHALQWGVALLSALSKCKNFWASFKQLVKWDLPENPKDPPYLRSQKYIDYHHANQLSKISARKVNLSADPQPHRHIYLGSWTKH